MTNGNFSIPDVLIQELDICVNSVQGQFHELYLLCVPERMGMGESVAISKNMSAIFMIYFWFMMSNILGSLYKKIF